MAKNFTLSAVGDLVNFGKSNVTFKGISSTQGQIRDSLDSAFANLAGADAAADDDFVTLRQLNNATLGLSWKQPVRVASTTNVNISSPGSAMDGVTLANNDRVFIKDNSVATENGIYVFDTPSTPLVRSTDMAVGSNAVNAAIFVSEGATQADRAYVETAEPAIVGTNALTFQQFASVTAGVSSIANAAGITGTSIIQSGAAPIPTLYAISGQSGVLSTSVVGSDLQVSVDAGGIGTTQLADDGVTEDKVAAGVAVLYRRIQVLFSDFPATPGNNDVNLGSALPTNAIAQGGIVLVTTAFNNIPDMQVGTAGTVDAVFGTRDLDLSAEDTYISSKSSVQSGSQLIARLTTTGTQPSIGQAEVMVNFIRPT